MTELVESKKGRVLDHLATYPVVVAHIDLDNRQPPLLTQIDSYLLHIEAGLL